MSKGICGRCYDEDVEVFPANCSEKPEKLLGLPIGQYHCPDCGAMVMAGMTHFYICKPCLRREHPTFDNADTLIENLPLDWGHYPSDTQEGWEMLCRAKAKFDALERELARKDGLLREAMKHLVGETDGSEDLFQRIRRELGDKT